MSIRTNVTKLAYMKSVSVYFIYNDTATDMNANKIQYIVIEHMYDKNTMPIIYMSISLESSLYSKVIKCKNSAKIYLRIQSYNAYSGAPLYKDYINSQFTYFVSSLTPNYSDTLSSANDNADSNYRTLTIGLMDMTIMNTLRKSFYGIKKNIDQHTLIYNAIEDTKIIMKCPKYNKEYDTFIVPPLSSRQKMLEYIFRRDPFYDTEFLYFIDYDRSYLLDRSGDTISTSDGTKDTVIIDAESVLTDEAYNEGMMIKDDSYFFYIDPANVNVILDSASEKIANQLVAITDGGASTVDLDINNTEDSSIKQTFKRYDINSTQPIVDKNISESSQVGLEIIKGSIDSSIITPNRSFLLKNYINHSEYNGRYMLLYKKEIIYGNSGQFTTTMTLGLKKLNDYQQSNTAYSTTTASTTKVTSTSAKSGSYSTKTTSTSASKKATSTSNSNS